ncbi:Fic family protein [Mycetohabitans sp. B2]|nr:Fic family protein [Mycetohabitans sp. B2]MCF7694681.1 Fic family protein [Mycetohabitans sp. B2]
MVHNSDNSTADILFSSENEAQARALRRLVEAGSLRRVYAGVYTRNLDSPLEAVVIRNWATIVSHLLPDAVLAYKSALEHRPVNGVLYVRRGRTRRTLELPGLLIEVYPGPGPLYEAPAPDVLYKNIALPSEARGFLDNLVTGRGASQRVLPQDDLEARLDKILTIRGDVKLNELRDKARAVAHTLGMKKEGSRLDGIIGAMLGTHEQKRLQSKLALARAAGKPYDPERIDLFDTLFAQLSESVFQHIADPAAQGVAMENFAFFEAYFSNYIEGTTFEVAEAEKIIFEGAIIENRPEDSHDILGTFRVATSAAWRNTTATTAEQFLHWLKTVNALVMEARQDKLPGQWKEQSNQAGNTLFVAPELVPGTLKQGFERISALTDPMARALMTMFVVTEVHPFRDGNGRTARLAMNSVLSEANLCRIIVPTVYREDYLLPLKRLSNQKDAAAFIQSMARIQDWTSRFDYAQPRQALRQQLEQSNAFQEDLRNYRLIFPENASPYVK